MTDARTTVTVRFEVGAEPIAGTVAANDEEVGFAGWIEFAALIDRLRTEVLPAAGSGPPLSPRPSRSAERPEAPPGS